MLWFDNEAYEHLADDFARLANHSLRVSTMTLTSRLVSSNNIHDVMDRARSLTPRSCVGCFDRPSVAPSAFCRGALEIRPFPSAFPGVCIRLYATGSLLITGCKHPDQAVAALHDTCRLLDVTCTFPTVQLVNATSSFDRLVSLDRVRDLLSSKAEILRVTRPEKQHRLIIKTRSGCTIMVYSSGKYTVHGKHPRRLAELAHWMKKFL